VNKIDLIEAEFSKFDILAFTETWLNSETPNNNISLNTYLPPFRCDRNNRIGGGVMVYVKDYINAIRRSDLEVQGIESVWIEIKHRKNRILLGTFYRPPNLANENWLKIEHSIDLAFNSQCKHLLITGDLNENLLNPLTKKIKNILLNYNLTQLITEPTRYTESSSSLIDVFIVNNLNFVQCSFVGDPCFEN